MQARASHAVVPPTRLVPVLMLSNPAWFGLRGPWADQKGHAVWWLARHSPYLSAVTWSWSNRTVRPQSQRVGWPSPVEPPLQRRSGSAPLRIPWRLCNAGYHSGRLTAEDPSRWHFPTRRCFAIVWRSWLTSRASRSDTLPARKSFCKLVWCTHASRSPGPFDL